MIATTAKALQFKAARAVNTRKPLDPAPMLDTMAAAWDETMTTLTARYCLSRNSTLTDTRDGPCSIDRLRNCADRWVACGRSPPTTPGRAQAPADLETLAPGLDSLRRADAGGGGAPRSRQVGPRPSARFRCGRLVVSLPLHCRPTAGSHPRLHFEGLATVADVWLNGTHILSSENMFTANAVDVGGVLRC